MNFEKRNCIHFIHNNLILLKLEILFLALRSNDSTQGDQWICTPSCKVRNAINLLSHSSELSVYVRLFKYCTLTILILVLYHIPMYIYYIVHIFRSIFQDMNSMDNVIMKTMVCYPQTLIKFIFWSLKLALWSHKQVLLK